MSKIEKIKYIPDDLFFPTNDQLNKKELLWNIEERRNWWYKPTIEEISKECEYLLNLKK
jgi:hypothetical protein